MRILGIETSCDDTGVAIYDHVEGLIFNELLSQSSMHANYGGVVPELAARKHQQNIIILVQRALQIVKKKFTLNSIDAIAYTAGPGLVGSLIVGATVASALALSLSIPIVLVNHMEAHLLSCMLEQEIKNDFKFPLLGLLVSGGHTQLIKIKKLGDYKIIGNSLDDAAGDTIDKIAQLLGINYPGGSGLSKLARLGKGNQFEFPRPMVNHSGFNFSFSGLKTYVTRVILSHAHDLQTQANIAKEFEEAVVDSLVIKCKKAMKVNNIKQIIIAGGVSANLLLRKKLKMLIKKFYPGKLFYAKTKFCTDNGAMIAFTGMLRFQSGDYLESQAIVRPKWSISDLSSFS